MKQHILAFNDFCVNEEITRVPFHVEKHGMFSAPSGYKNLQLGKNTNIEKILKFIFDGGEAGRSWKEIHKFIVEDIKGLKQDLSNEGNRGYYSSIFTNFLPYFASRSNKKWIIHDPVLIAYFSGDFKKANELISGKVTNLLDKYASRDSTKNILDRIKLAKHPNISDETLLKLAMNDPEEAVRAAAKKNPRFAKLPGVDFLSDLGAV